MLHLVPIPYCSRHSGTVDPPVRRLNTVHYENVSTSYEEHAVANPLSKHKADGAQVVQKLLDGIFTQYARVHLSHKVFDTPFKGRNL